MNYISEIFERLDLQQIRGFLLNGDARVQIDEGSYLERLERAEKPILDLLKAKFTDAEYLEVGANCVRQLNLLPCRIIIRLFRSISQPVGRDALIPPP